MCVIVREIEWCVCPCVCVCVSVYVCEYVYVCVCLSVCMCVFVGGAACLSHVTVLLAIDRRLTPDQMRMLFCMQYQTGLWFRGNR